MGMDIKASGDLIAVSRAKQSDANTAATLNALILYDESSGVNVAEERAGNQGDKTGFVEATKVDVKDRTSDGSLNQSKATPDGLAHAFGMIFHGGTPTHSNVAGPVYRHTFKLDTYPVNPNYFTAAHRRGGSSGGAADFRRHYGIAANTLTLNLAKNEFLKTQLGILGIGKFDDSIYTEEISAADNATSLTLGKDPLGDSHTNVTVWANITDTVSGQFSTPVTATAYNAGTNALTITSLGGSGATIKYRVTYQVKATESGYSWADLSGLSVEDEFTMKAGNLQIRMAGRYSESGGNPSFTGGQIAGCEIDSFTYKLDWKGQTGKCWRTGQTDEPTATSVELGDPEQTVEVSRQVIDYVLKAGFDLNAPMSLYVDAQGPIIDAVNAPGERFFFRLYVPKVQMLSKSHDVVDKKWAEKVQFLVLKDDANGWPSAVAQIQNKIASYA